MGRSFEAILGRGHQGIAHKLAHGLSINFGGLQHAITFRR
jgi:hypothetical protein